MKILLHILLLSVCFGQFTFTVVDSVEVADFADNHDIINLNECVFVTVAGNDSSEAVLKTWSVETGAIVLVDTLVIGGSSTLEFALMKTNDDLDFVCVNATDRTIQTFEVDGNYAISKIDSIHEVSLLYTYVDLTKIDSTHFFLASSVENQSLSGSRQVAVETYSIDDDSDNITQVDELIYDLGYRNSRASKIDATHYTTYISDQKSHPTVSTFELDGAYNISKVDSVTFYAENSSYRGNHGAIIDVDATHALVAYDYHLLWIGFTAYDIMKVTYYSFDNGTADNVTVTNTLSIGGLSYYGLGIDIADIHNTDKRIVASGDSSSGVNLSSYTVGGTVSYNSDATLFGVGENPRVASFDSSAFILIQEDTSQYIRLMTASWDAPAIASYSCLSGWGNDIGGSGDMVVNADINEVATVPKENIIQLQGTE